MDNPVKFLLKSHGDLFKVCYEGWMGLLGDIREYVLDDVFVEHMRDVVGYRVERPYEEKSFGSGK
ncbi:hypothetical protein AXY43_02020 [Clostridium sp. MF28]|uniref:hypothetical protein n=1 Tax=Clostridium TaxID=1485 RepID=UPI000CF92E60|nr:MULTISPECIES: hypothetical protein [Clostridium]AVK46897.1 hypothetical protein AXY43_02020 [Clostridium sp. MF28]MBE6086506.1 hypothetical protein [Clostridium beijerinckii]PSM59422.1 hypothetical protein C4L39_01390 [Clostridium diolis]